jgi:hypothetical protein
MYTDPHTDGGVEPEGAATRGRLIPFGRLQGAAVEPGQVQDLA